MGEFSIWIFVFMAACVLLEMAYSKWSGRKLYQAGETFVNIACGILERLLDLLIFVLLFGVFRWIHGSGYTLFDLPHPLQAWMYLPLLPATDFCWYWYHRCSHRINLLWGLHIVHHQSEDYNLSIFFRATGLQSLVRIFFWLPLPLIGFAPLDCLAGIGFLAVYQFLMHTQVPGRFRLLEPWIATPSHHRVHHAANAHYIDKNYAGLFTFYDRLFGSYALEEEAPRYGITNTFRRTNLWSVYFDYFQDLWTVLRQARTGQSWRTLLFGPPEKMPSDAKISHVALLRSDGVHLWIITATLLVNAALLFVVLTGVSTNGWVRFSLIGFMVGSILLTGRYLEKEPDRPKK